MHLIVLKKIFCICSVYPYMNFKKRCIIIILLKINVWYIFFYTKPRFNCIILLLLFLDLKNMSRQLPRFLMSKYKIIDFQDNIGYHFCIDKSRELKIYKIFQARKPQDTLYTRTCTTSRSDQRTGLSALGQPCRRSTEKMAAWSYCLVLTKGNYSNMTILNGR